MLLLLAAGLSAWLVGRREGAEEDTADADMERGSAQHGSEPSSRTQRELVQIALSGTVRTPEGSTIADAEVCASCANCETAEMPAAVCTRANAAGAYALEARSVRSVIISATGEGYEVGYARDGLPVTMRAAPQTGLDIMLKRGGARLSGTVVDALGGPIPRARVMIERADGPTRWVRETKADDDGHFALLTSRGFQVVRAEVDGYAPRARSVVAPAQDVTIQLTPESAVRGRVLVSGTGEPVEGVELSARPDGFPARSAGAVSDQDGRFALAGLEPGRYRLLAESDAWQPSGEAWVELQLADIVEDVVVEVSPAARVVGRVQQRDKEGLKPCPRGSVTLEPMMTDDVAPKGGAQPRTIGVRSTIGEDGYVRFRGVSSGRFEVMMHCPGHVLAEGPPVLDVAAQALDVSWIVEPGLALTVNVVDALSRPVPKAPVLLVSERDDRPDIPIVMSLTSDERGHAVVRHELMPGKYTVHPAEGAEGEPASVELRRGAAPAELTLKLAGSGTIDVVAHDEAGHAVSGLQVTALPDPSATGTPSPASAATGARLALGMRALEEGDGHYRIGPLKPGSYEVILEDGINPSAQGKEAKRVEVRSGDALKLQVSIARGGVVRGKVVNESGDPEDNAWVSATPEGEQLTPGARAQFMNDPPGRVLTNADGEFELTGLRPGARYTLRVKQPYNNAAVLHGVSEGETVRFVLPASGSIAGVLVDARGAPVSHAQVSAQNAETRSTRGAISGADGSFSIDRIPAGRVQLLAGVPSLGFARLELDLAPGQHLTGQALPLGAFPTQPAPGISPVAPPSASPVAPAAAATAQQAPGKSGAPGG